jgi:hypothetical protein
MSKAVRTPKARSEGLVIKKLDRELLVYDLDTHKAHCLNPSAALVWSHCDGRKSVAEITRALSEETNGPFTEEVVRLALSQLERFHLLEKSAVLPKDEVLLSRRELGRRLGLAGVAALPFIASIAAPPAAAAATCAGVGVPCLTNSRCCSGLCVSGRCACLDSQSPCTTDAQCCSNRCGSANNKCLP